MERGLFYIDFENVLKTISYRLIYFSRASASINVENDINNLKVKRLTNEAKLCNDILNIVENSEAIPSQTTLVSLVFSSVILYLSQVNDC